MTATLIGGAVALLMSGACVGLGATLLARLGALGGMGEGERLGMSFALGFGALGWIVFFLAVPGLFHPWLLGALLAASLAGLATLRRDAATPRAPYEALDAIGWSLVAGLAATLLGDLLEGMSPPADADTLAYHFALPKQFIGAGRLEFVPRAVDGAVPLLPHMTYTMALALGGERAMTLWTMK